MRLPRHKTSSRVLVVGLVSLSTLLACQTATEYPPSQGHLGVEPDPVPVVKDIPRLIERTPYLPNPPRSRKNKKPIPLS